MAKDPEPTLLARLADEAQPTGERFSKKEQGVGNTAVRRTSQRVEKEKVEAEEIIRSLTERERGMAVMSLIRLTIWLLSGMAFFALLIVFLLGLGVITLPTALVLAVISPLLSGVVALLGILVKFISRHKG